MSLSFEGGREVAGADDDEMGGDDAKGEECERGYKRERGKGKVKGRDVCPKIGMCCIVYMIY